MKSRTYYRVLFFYLLFSEKDSNKAYSIRNSVSAEYRVDIT